MSPNPRFHVNLLLLNHTHSSAKPCIGVVRDVILREILDMLSPAVERIKSISLNEALYHHRNLTRVQTGHEL